MFRLMLKKEIRWALSELTESVKQLSLRYSTAKSALFRELLPFQKMSVRDIWNSMPATIRGQMCITSCFPYSTIFRIWKPKFPHLHIRLTKSREILTSLLKGRPCLLNSLKEQAVCCRRAICSSLTSRQTTLTLTQSHGLKAF